MKLGRLDVRSSLADLRLDATLHLLAKAGWPTLVGLLAAACGLAMLAAAWHFDQQAHHLRSPEGSPLLGESAFPAGARQFARATEAIFTVPDDSSHIDDLSWLFKLAKAKGVHIGTVEYHQEQSPSLQVLVRTLDVRVHEDYPKLKSFLAEVLGSMPHATLQEIRVDRKDAGTLRGQVLLKLAFVYRVAGTVPAGGSPRPNTSYPDS